MAARQDSDHLAWDRNDDTYDAAIAHIRETPVSKITEFAGRIYGKRVSLVNKVMAGGFNVLYPLQVEGSSTNVVLRVPLPNLSAFLTETKLGEAAIATYLAEQTQLPVPAVYHHGIDPDFGPFMILQDLQSQRDMSDVLGGPQEDPSERPILDRNIPADRLKMMYLKVARCVVQLAQPTFSRIGALVETRPNVYDVSERPMTLNMNNMVQMSNIPRSVFPPKHKTYATADEWYVQLAEMQIATLLFQHNDIVKSEDDCRTKYVARQLFRRLAKQGRLSAFGFAEDTWSAPSQRATLPMPSGTGSFRLWGEDFRPANILVDEEANEKILGVIDWEFAYVGPTQFALDPPWWLLLEAPEKWEDDLEDWSGQYDERLGTWLTAMGEAEDELGGLGPEAPSLSAYMRESWETGRFWLNYAARKSWAFDAIYWTYLDERFFGERTAKDDILKEDLWKTRVHLLTHEEKQAMEPLVQIKMEESKHRVLVEWDPAEARQRLSSFLFD
ncbi:hypothetical protein PG993_008214 [Apiospora rasikravindrae]|uniref:Aminoglycoside phosphotransferase domain-containing protein n=1 Tax=Apiospora rasikravindrae TaxID=990691 RepID=A0ABR1SZP4_9PEZI